MRFCMVTTFYPPYHFGGDATYVRALARQLVAEGHSVDVIHCEDAYLVGGQPPAPTETDDGVTVHRLKSRFGVISPLISQQTGGPGLKKNELKKLLAGDFDVVHFHNISLMGGPSVLKMSRSPVTLYTLHEHWLICPTHILWKNKSKACDSRQCFTCCLKSRVPPQWWRYTSLVKESLKNVDCLLSPSQFTAKQHQHLAEKTPIVVLPLFSNLQPNSKKTLATDDTRPRFLFVGRVTKSKGITELLALFSVLPAYDLQVVGKGDLLASLKKKYALCSNITFTNELPQEQLVALYQNATALIFPSRAPETFGLAIVEAFACGIPAIVRDAGASRELIDQTGAGFVFQHDDELKEIIIKLSQNPTLCEELGQKGLKSYQDFFTPKLHLKNYLTIIQDIQQIKGL